MADLHDYTEQLNKVLKTLDDLQAEAMDLPVSDDDTEEDQFVMELEARTNAILSSAEDIYTMLRKRAKA